MSEIKPELDATPWKISRRVAGVVALIAVLVAYTAGVLSQPMLLPADSSAADSSAADSSAADSSAADSSGADSSAVETAAATEMVTEIPLSQSYSLIERELAELSRLAERGASPGMEQAVEKLAEEVRALRTLNPYYRFKELEAATLPAGVPPIYGDILNVSFDQVEHSTRVLSSMDPTFGADRIVLTGNDLQRYIRVGTQTSCRYCCSALTLVVPTGEAACQCEHSQAMRGLAAYLITTHGQEYSDEELVVELNSWRATYFPRQTLVETLATMKEAGEPGIDDILAEFPQFMPDMVGAC